MSPGGTGLSFPWRVYALGGGSGWIVVGTYYGGLMIAPGLKGLSLSAACEATHTYHFC